MQTFAIHVQTERAVDAFLRKPTHALLLLGASGIGKGSLASHIATQLLKLPDADALEHYPHFKRITSDKDTVSIENIRSLQQFVRLRTTGKAAIRRIIVVEHADTMTAEAQNAFLKLLEEPPADTVIMLTAPHIHDLLPTIRSRVQTLTITPPSKADLQKYFAAEYSAAQITQAYFLSGGLPGLMTALLRDDASHPLMQSVTQAKLVLQQSLFERLLTVESVAKDRTNAILFCEALGRIAEAGIGQASAKADEKRLRQWHKIRKETYDALESFSVHANTKLVLTNLLLQL